MTAADWSSKGFLAVGADPLAMSDVIGRSIFDGPFTWPLMTLRDSAVRHNVAQLARYCADSGVLLAPHAKTTMAPALVRRQIEAGAWGMTVATANQALVVRHFGVERVLLANEILDPRALRRLADEADADPDFDFYCYVDSLAGVRAVVAAAGARPFQVLVELGRAGGRTGCRDISALADVATAAKAAGLQVVGVAGYEGGLPDEAAVRGYLGGVRKAVLALHSAGLLTPGRPPLVTAGGSSWFDVVAEELTRDWPDGFDVTVVLRSGAYIGHDDGFYRAATPYATRLIGAGALRPALRLWAQVLSTPEPGLAITGFGKRDASYDLGLPLPMLVRSGAGPSLPARGLTVTKLDDQHAYLDVSGSSLVVGDLIGFGVSHPCTAFDKWATMPLVDDDEIVLDVLHTYF